MANKGKFINTTHSDTVKTLVNNAKDIIKNPYYIHAGSLPTITTYFNINKEMSTLDEGFKGIMSDVGKDSPLWYNVIEEFYIFTSEQMQIQMDHGEFGAESSEISGEATLLPNTIIPYVGDYFKIDYLEENLMFRVTGASPDTLENGANAYKIQFTLESGKTTERDFNLKDRYTMITNNIGTGFNAVLHNKKVDLIKELENYLYRLRVYFSNIFYNDRVQAFVYLYKGMRFYDPYMTQFIMDNNILIGGDEYIYVTHQTPLRSYFPIEYDRTFFRCLEKKDYKHIRKYDYNAISRYIDSIDTSIFSTRQEDYLEVEFRYDNPHRSFYGIIPCFPDELIEHIESKELFDDENSIYNIIIKYMLDMDIESRDFEFMDFDIHNNVKIFYSVPCIIYCIESFIKRMMIENTK